MSAERRGGNGQAWKGGLALVLLALTLQGAGLRIEKTGEGGNALTNPFPTMAAESSNAAPARARASNQVGAFVIPQGQVVEGWAPHPPRTVVSPDLEVPEADPSMVAEEDVWEQVGLVLGIVLLLAVAVGLFLVIQRFRRG